MKVLNIATEEKQDVILSNFPISAGDRGLSSYLKTSSPQFRSGESLALSITGKGSIDYMILEWATTGSILSPYVKIVIDGQIYYNGDPSSLNFNPLPRSVALPGKVYFENSFQVFAVAHRDDYDIGELTVICTCNLQ